MELVFKYWDREAQGAVKLSYSGDIVLTSAMTSQHGGCNGRGSARSPLGCCHRSYPACTNTEAARTRHNLLSISLSHSDILFSLISSPLFIVMHCPSTYKDFSVSVDGTPTSHLLRNLVYYLY